MQNIATSKVVLQLTDPYFLLVREVKRIYCLLAMLTSIFIMFVMLAMVQFFLPKT